MKYPDDMIKTIARCMYVVPIEFPQSGVDWVPSQIRWDNTLSEMEKQIWYDKAIKWLNDLKDNMPDAYNFYIKQWTPGIGTTAHLFDGCLPSS